MPLPTNKLLLSQSNFFALEENLAAVLGQQGAEEVCLSVGLRRWPETTSGCSRR